MAGKKQARARKPRRRQRPTTAEKDKDLWGEPVIRLLSLRQYATHRGVALAAVQKAIQSGRIDTEPSGKINPKLADEQWQANTDTSRRPPGAAQFGDGNNNGRGNTAGDEQMRTARLIRATFEAKLVKLDFDQKAGMVVKKDEVYKQQFAATRQLRDKLLTLGDRIAPLVKGKATITEIAEAANAEVRTALVEFCEELNGNSDAID